MRKNSLLLALLAVAFASTASAQQPPTVRIRGTIEAVDGPTLSIKSRDGSDVKVRVTDNVAVFGVTKTSLSEIKEGSYIGVTAMPEPDGTQKAIAVHIFPENQRGAAEGFRPWDLRANSTMTNATVAETVAGVNGQSILVKYKDGEKKAWCRRKRRSSPLSPATNPSSRWAPRSSSSARRKKKTERWKRPVSMSGATASARRCDAKRHSGARVARARNP